MSAQSANTIWTKAYTPAGLQVGITIAFEAGQLTSASEVDAMITGAGYSVVPAGAKAGEVIELVTHVSKRIKVNGDGRPDTPVIAFYLENPALKYKYDHMYLNTAEQVAEFEQVSGLKLSDIPEWEGNSFLNRTDPKSGKYIKAVSTPFEVAAAEGTYKDSDGNTKTTMKIQRLLGGTPANVTTMPQSATGQQTTSADWLKNEDALNKVKVGLDALKVNYGNDAVSKARETIIAGAFDTPYLFIQALENEVKRIGA